MQRSFYDRRMTRQVRSDFASDRMKTRGYTRDFDGSLSGGKLFTLFLLLLDQGLEAAVGNKVILFTCTSGCGHSTRYTVSVFASALAGARAISRLSAPA